MKKMSYWGKPVALCALALSAVGSLMAPTPASMTQKLAPTSLQHQGNLQLAQGLVGQCRAAKQRIFVYSQRSETSQTVRTLAPDEKVTIADNGVRGWVGISDPEVGYVRAEDLTKCLGTAATPKPTTTTTTTGSGVCRVVTYKGTEGLAIRDQPDRNARRVGGVYPGNQVTLKSDPPQLRVDSEGRAFVEVTAPTAGWLSYGYPSAKSSNLGSCP